jgi:hypothetical protein
MNPYEFVHDNPTRFVDPTGLLKVDSSNPDIKAAFGKLENSKHGQTLLEEINRLESCANKTVRIILTPSPNGSSVTQADDKEIQVWINPYDQMGAFPNGTVSHNTITGPNPADFQIGTELDALLYHELQHALFYLTQACGEKHCIKVGESVGAEGSLGWLEEEGRITRLENEYRAEKGYIKRYRHGSSPEQDESIGNEVGRGTRGTPVLVPPDFRGEQLRRERERRQSNTQCNR